MGASIGNTNSVKHGMSGTKIYRKWKAMRNRCENTRNPSYHNYGGRGIKVCDEWENFGTFYEWACANGYDENAERGECTIDRIDNDRGYCPDNCRFVSSTVQARNTRTVNRFVVNEELVTLPEIAERNGISRSVIYDRVIRQGWSIDDAISMKTGMFNPVGKKNLKIRKFIHENHVSQREVAKRCNVNEHTISRWLKGYITESQEKRIVSAVIDIAKERGNTHIKYG